MQTLVLYLPHLTQAHQSLDTVHMRGCACVDVDVLYVPTSEMYFCQVLALASQASSGCEDLLSQFRECDSGTRVRNTRVLPKVRPASWWLTIWEVSVLFSPRKKDRRSQIPP